MAWTGPLRLSTLSQQERAGDEALGGLAYPPEALTLTLSRWEGGMLNCAPSADAVAGGGNKISRTENLPSVNCSPSRGRLLSPALLQLRNDSPVLAAPDCRAVCRLRTRSEISRALVKWGGHSR
jgi:hypothetical protein